MRPIKLTLSAFISYKSTQTIDFTEIDGHNLFLITGETGAGKSTIFDAICFALYGKLSGEGGEKTNFLKCHLAAEKDICKVNFSFKIGNDQYEIERIPTQMVFSERKGEMISRQGSVILTLPNGEVITKTNEANSYIEKVIGLDHKQFKKVVMLAQGEFKEFLVADSSEKQQILRKIFGTEVFDDFSKQLLDMEKLLETKLSAQKNLVDTYIGQFDFGDDENIKSVLDRQEINTKEFLQFSKEFLTTKYEEILNNRESLQKLREELSKINIEECEKTNANFEKLNKAQEIFKRLSENIEFHNARKAQLEKIKSARKIYPLYEKINENEKQINITNDNLEATKKQLNELLCEFEKVKKDYENLPLIQKENEVLTLKTTELGYSLDLLNKKDIKESNLAQKQKEEKNFIKSLDLIKFLIKKCDIIEQIKVTKEISYIISEKDTLEKEIIKKEQEYKKIKLDYEKATDNFYKATASFIAENLKENAPCPVCGSIHHPNIATKSIDEISKEQLNQKQKDYTKSNEQLIKLKTSLSSINEKLEEKLKNIGVSISEFEEFKNKLQNDYNLIENDILMLVSKDKITDDKYQDKEYLIQSQTDLTQNLGRVKGEINSLENEIKEILSSVKDCLDKNSITKQIEENNQIIKNNVQKVQNVTENFNNINNKKTVLSERINSFENQILLLKENQNKYISDFNSQIEKSIFDTIESFISILYFIDREEQIEIECKDFEKNFYEVTSQKEFLEKELAGKQKIDVSVLADKKKSISQEINKIEAFNEKLLSSYNTNKNYIDEIEKIISAMGDGYEKLKNVAKLSHLANGKTESRMNFESYVLSAYFNEIVAHANARLYSMSMGRFSLLRKEERSTRGKLSGLDLEILDRHSGTKRHISTLSGGESFKASLSLALGLADVLQNHYGGIKIETMFIDEGFGSLDEKSLDSAVETLYTLEKSGVLVGIISHVVFLREKIPTKLIVKSTSEGSIAKFSVI